MHQMVDQRLFRRTIRTCQTVGFFFTSLVLVQAAWFGLPALVKELLEAGADPQVLDLAMLTPLHVAVMAPQSMDKLQPTITCIAKACPELLGPSWRPGQGKEIKEKPLVGNSKCQRTLRGSIPKQSKKTRELIEKAS